MTEFWVNVYEDGTIGAFMDSEAMARECIRHDMKVINRQRLVQAESEIRTIEIQRDALVENLHRLQAARATTTQQKEKTTHEKR